MKDLILKNDDKSGGAALSPEKFVDGEETELLNGIMEIVGLAELDSTQISRPADIIYMLRP